MAAAADGYVATCRQTLVGGDYALVDNAAWRANPDFYVARLWGEVVEGGGAGLRGEARGGAGLRGVEAAANTTYLFTNRRPVIASDARRSLRAQGACGVDGSFVLAVANVAGDAVRVTLDFGDPKLEGRRDEWVLTAHADDPRAVDLNAERLSGGADAPLAPRVVDAPGTVFEAPPWSVAFVSYPNLRPPACVATLA